jgi:hypothetical protein
MINKKTSDYKIGRAAKPGLRGLAQGRQGGSIMVAAWTILAGLATLTVGTAVCAVESQRGETAITCTNPVSGTSWQIKIDYDRRTVDSNPARIGEATISWHDATDGGNYTLDRKSGTLTVIIASATGGNFLYDHCRLED